CSRHIRMLYWLGYDYW
nr:immunoglobulin heavy chain junction region [Macaca mulatta]